MAIKVFGNFARSDMSQERNRIRTITTNIIDCSYESPFGKKDFTDFIMLDHIYQEAIQNELIKQFVIVTGDGHFSSVATFLRMYMEKIVGIYSVQRTLSRQLRECSNWTRIIEIFDDNEDEYIRIIATSLKRNEEEGKIATFRKTCEIVSGMYRIDYDVCRRILQNMIHNNLITVETIAGTEGDYEFRRLLGNWSLLERYLIGEPLEVE